MIYFFSGMSHTEGSTGTDYSEEYTSDLESPRTEPTTESSEDEENLPLVFEQEEQATKELLEWFNSAMEKGSVTHTMRIRKTVRDKLKILKKATSQDNRYQVGEHHI